MKWSRSLARVVLALFLLGVCQASGKARLFLLAGQSNMAGAGLFDELKKSEQEAPKGVKIWHKNQWRELGPGISANEGRFGPELAFGRAMRKAFPDDEIYLIKTAAGGTSMHKHWNVESGSMRKRFLAAARAARKNLEDGGIEYEIEGMLWMQGESDAAQGKGAEYEESLRKFVKDIRREFEKKEMPFIMGQILPTFDKPEGNGPLVRAAQATIAKELKNVVVFDTDNFERINKGHYNHVGQLKLGNTFAEHLLKMMKE